MKKVENHSHMLLCLTPPTFHRGGQSYAISGSLGRLSKSSEVTHSATATEPGFEPCKAAGASVAVQAVS